ncbi:MAG: FHA domain-containing protein [Candidatus Dormibacteria bacterium]
MREYLEVAKPTGVELCPLEGGRVTIGRHPTNSIVLAADHNVSRTHAVLEQVGPSWCIQDLGSRNGTYVNGARIGGRRALHPGDEVRAGTTRLVFRVTRPDSDDPTGTVAHGPAPMLTPREREVLIALCRPVFSGDVLAVPAAVREIAAQLVVGEDAVKQHLIHLYDKFDIPADAPGGRRVQLAREAVLRGAVNRTDADSAVVRGTRH